MIHPNLIKKLQDNGFTGETITTEELKVDCETECIDDQWIARSVSNPSVVGYGLSEDGALVDLWVKRNRDVV